LSAPVARPTLATASSGTVAPGTDMVMCLSCHDAHGSQYDYILKYDYTVMTAGAYGNIPAAQLVGGCLACHTEKGVLPANR
jgi:predicted CXXCH cytochrome family protein